MFEFFEYIFISVVSCLFPPLGLLLLWLHEKDK